MELPTSLRNKLAKLFLTLTLNMSDNPSVAPIIDNIKKAFRNATPGERNSALNSYMALIIRAWSRTVKHFVNLLLKSEDQILGEVTDVWCRAEFQTSAGNPQHYHLLIWSKIAVEELLKFIQCSQKSL